MDNNLDLIFEHEGIDFYLAHRILFKAEVRGSEDIHVKPSTPKELDVFILTLCPDPRAWGANQEKASLFKDQKLNIMKLCLPLEE